MDSSAFTDPAMSELWYYGSTLKRQIPVESHHDENSRRTDVRKSVQRIQEEDGRTLRNDEEEACHGVCQIVEGM